MSDAAARGGETAAARAAAAAAQEASAQAEEARANLEVKRSQNAAHLSAVLENPTPETARAYTDSLTAMMEAGKMYTASDKAAADAQNAAQEAAHKVEMAKQAAVDAIFQEARAKAAEEVKIEMERSEMPALETETGNFELPAADDALGKEDINARPGQPFTFFSRKGGQTAPRDAIITQEWEFWTPKERQLWTGLWQPNLPEHWTNAIKEETQTDIVRALNSAPEEILYFWHKAGSLFTGNYYDASAKKGAHFDSGTGKVYMDLNTLRGYSQRIGLKSDLVTFFHENGHGMDEHMAIFTGTSIRDKAPMLCTLLAQDLLNYVNEALTSNGLHSVRDLNHFMPHQSKVLWDTWAKDPHLFSSISDLAEGLSNGAIGGGYGHLAGDANYWNGKSALEMEAIAHMVEATILGGERLAVFQQIFPKALSYYRGIFKQLRRNIK